MIDNTKCWHDVEQLELWHIAPSERVKWYHHARDLSGSSFHVKCVSPPWLSNPSSRHYPTEMKHVYRKTYARIFTAKIYTIARRRKNKKHAHQLQDAFTNCGISINGMLLSNKRGRLLIGSTTCNYLKTSHWVTEVTHAKKNLWTWNSRTDQANLWWELPLGDLLPPKLWRWASN